MNTNQLKLYRELIPVWCQDYMDHTNTLRGQKKEILALKVVVHKVSNRLQAVNKFAIHKQIVYFITLRKVQ